MKFITNVMDFPYINETQLKRNADEAKKYLPYIRHVSSLFNIQIPIIFGIGSRESDWGLRLKPSGPTGTGDWTLRRGQLPPDGLGWGRGLMQIDYAAHPAFMVGDKWKDPEQCIEYAIGTVLLGNIHYLYKKYPKIFNGLQLLQAAIAAYNCGAGNIENIINGNHNIDELTTHSNYSADVLARARWLMKNPTLLA